MSEKIQPSELIHIWKCEPCEAGDTLSGGETVKNLQRLGLIQSTDIGYITTSRGKYIVQRMIEHLDRLNIEVVIDIVVTEKGIKLTPEELQTIHNQGKP